MRAIAAFLLSLCVLALPTAAQEEQPPAPSRPVTKPVSTSAPRADGVGITVPVSGVTPENKRAVERKLAGLRFREHVCPECQRRAAKPGECPDCKRPFEAKERPLLVSQVVSIPMRGRPSLAFTPAPGTELRISQIESALKELGVTLSRTAMVLVPGDVAVFAGPLEDEKVAALTKAFADAKLDVKLAADAETNELHVALTSGSTAYGSLLKAARAGAPEIAAPDLLYRGRAQ